MDERFADLSPITYAEYENIAQLALCFFSPLQNKQFRQIAESGNEDRIIPLNENSFFSFLCKIDKTYDKKLHKIKRILSLMERAEILTFEGNGNSALLGRHYYSLKELTNLQRRNSLWLGEAFGFPFLQEKLKANVIHITGITKQGDTGNGTGFLINRNTILTCKHVISDMIPDDNLTILGEKYTYKVKKSEEYDISLLVLDKCIDSINCFPAFNDANILDEVIIMGYPPIVGADKDYLLSQKGEVNSVVNDYLCKTTNLVLSSVTRPGNSGGPVISKNGYIVGMVLQFNTSTKSGFSSSSSSCSSTDKDDKEENCFPFYMAMQGKALFNGIKAIDPNVDIFFEDYQ